MRPRLFNRPHQGSLLLHQHWLQEAANVQPTTPRKAAAPPVIPTGGRDCSTDHTKEACCSTSTGYMRPRMFNRPHQGSLLLHQHWLQEAATVQPTTPRKPAAPPALATGGRDCSTDHTKEACCSTSTGYRRPRLFNRPHQGSLLLHQHWLQEAATVQPTTPRKPAAPPALATGGCDCSTDHTKEACCSTSTGYRRPRLFNRPHQGSLLLHQHWLQEAATVQPTTPRKPAAPPVLAI